MGDYDCENCGEWVYDICPWCWYCTACCDCDDEEDQT